MEIPILYEDPYCIIVNKPNNILIHNSYYARNIKAPTLLDLLSNQYCTNFYPVHRLDRKTSGVLLLCKHKNDVSVFQKLFNSNTIQKEYIAIVRGFVTEEETINSPVKHPETGNYKEAETICIPLFTKELDIPVHPYATSRYSLVKLVPKTGRMHQLRIHMNKVSHPIVGDYKYGDRFHNRMFEIEFDCYNLFLHAYSLQFQHPKTNSNICIKTTFYKDWQKIFLNFGWDL